MRENLVELALGMPALRLGHVSYYGLTALLVAAAYGISILVPSVYVSLSFQFLGLNAVLRVLLAAEKGGFSGRMQTDGARASPPTCLPAHPFVPLPCRPCLMPRLQALLALVGSTACVTFSYFFPAALVR